MRNRTSQIIIGIAAIAVIVGVIIAVSSGGHHSSAHKSHANTTHSGTGALLVTANYLGIPRAQVRAEIRQGRTLAEIADARSGKSASGLVEALVSARAPAVEAAAAQHKLSKSATAARLAALRAVATARVNGKRRAGGTALAAASHYVGVPVDQLREKQRAGHSLAEIAEASGKSAAGLTAALISSQRAAIAAAEATGLLTPVQAAARRATLPARVARAVKRKPGGAAGAKG